jgi:hypothetical protein
MLEGFIRFGGRLQYADLPSTEQHPLLLDGSHPLLIKQTHSGFVIQESVRIVLTELRSEFWILRAHQVIKKVIRPSVPCKIAHNKRGGPFSVTGVDFTGPLYVKTGSVTSRSYVVLFTCATSWTVKTDLSTDRFLMAWQRFMGRRGLPHTIYSENAQTFQARNFLKSWQILRLTNTSHLTA